MPTLGFPIGGPLDLGGGGVSIPADLPLVPLLFTGTLATLPTTNYGTDVTAAPLLEDSWPLAGGQRAVAETFLRRITTPRGMLDFSPDDGIDVRQFLRDDMETADLYAAKAAIEREGEKEERLDSVAVAATLNRTTGVLQLTCALDGADGPFTLVLAVSDVTVDILDAQTTG